jgi:acyl-CoA reductase-like NAD-dependent aldehyde dehydrogenase
MDEYPYYIGGKFYTSKEKVILKAPDTQQELGCIYNPQSQDLELALNKAKLAQKEWQGFSIKDKSALLRQIAEVIKDNLAELAEIETKNVGKILKESLFVDVPLAAECFDYYADFLKTLEQRSFSTDFGDSYVGHMPFGVCAIFLPYNVPLMIFGFNVAAALAAGNSVIVKPSEKTPLSLLKLAYYLKGLDMPAGLINILNGSPQLGAMLAESAVDFISFTGQRKTASTSKRRKSRGLRNWTT